MAQFILYAFLLPTLLVCMMMKTDTPVSPNRAVNESCEVAKDTLEWPRPRFSERKDERRRMTEEAIENNGITDSRTLEALRHVPRHLFVPEAYRSFAYQNRPLPIGHNQTISQPYVVAYMTQMLGLKTGEKVLEIGTGSGYQAAVLAEITPHVYSMEIIEPLGKEAKKRFQELGYSTIKTKIGDGYQGWEKYAPYDAIILTAAAPEIPEPLTRQLKSGGVLIMPIGEQNNSQVLLKITKTKSGKLRKERKLSVRFVPMTGKVWQN